MVGPGQSFAVGIVVECCRAECCTAEPAVANFLVENFPVEAGRIPVASGQLMACFLLAGVGWLGRRDTDRLAA